MTIKEYLDTLETVTINEERVAKLVDIYGEDIPNIVKQIASFDMDDYFLDDEIRILSFEGIVFADEDLNARFKDARLIPLVDLMDGDYAVYNCVTSKWNMCNAYEGILFNEQDSLDKLLANDND